MCYQLRSESKILLPIHQHVHFEPFNILTCLKKFAMRPPFTDVLAVNHFPFCFFFHLFIAYPNGRVIEHETNPEEKMLVKNLALENYKAAAHGVMNFEPLKRKVLLELGKQVKREIKRYAKDSSNVFKYRGNIEKLAEFTNESLLKDVEGKIPSLHTFVKASVQGCQKVKNPVNQEALIISSYVNLWMPISNFAYQFKR